MEFADLYDLQIPRLMCPHCAALLTDKIVDTEFNEDMNEYQFFCSVCEKTSLARKCKALYTDDTGFIRHATLVAGEVQRQVRQKSKPNYFRTLPYLLARAEHFVTFLSWNISTWFLGAFAVAAQRHGVKVYGIVTGVDMEQDYVHDKVIKVAHALDLPASMNIKFVPKNDFQFRDIGSHVKHICIDGIFMFHGSANLTTQGWFNALQKRDSIQVTTDPEKIVQLHNEYFASAWMRLADKEIQEIDSGDTDFGDEILPDDFDDMPF